MGAEMLVAVAVKFTEDPAHTLATVVGEMLTVPVNTDSGLAPVQAPMVPDVSTTQPDVGGKAAVDKFFW